MTTKNPRLTITLQPLLAAQLRRMSELTGNSQSATIAELLSQSGPVFARIIQVLEAAKTAKDSLKGRLTDDVERAQSRMEQQLGLVLGEFEDVTAPLLESLETISRRSTRTGTAAQPRARTGASPAVSTPMSNRGVRYDPIATEKIAQIQIPVRPKAAKRGVKVRGVGK